MSSQRASQRISKPKIWHDDLIELTQGPPRKRIQKEPPVTETAAPQAVAVETLTPSEQWWIEQPLLAYQPAVVVDSMP